MAGAGGEAPPPRHGGEMAIVAAAPALDRAGVATSRAAVAASPAAAGRLVGRRFGASHVDRARQSINHK